MKPITFINPKALQLTIIMLRQYRPAMARLLPGPESYPSIGADVELTLAAHDISNLIGALNEMGDEWVAEARQKPSETNKDKLRQQCLAFILDEWINVGEQCQHQTNAIIH